MKGEEIAWKKSKETYIERSEEFLDIAKEVSELVGLLDYKKNKWWIRKKFVQLIEQAERDSYRQGLEAGLNHKFERLKDRIINEIEIEQSIWVGWR